MLMSLDKVVLITFTFMFSLKENESCCIAEDANVLTASLDSGDWGSHLPYSLQILVFSLSFFFFFRQGFTGGPATCMQLHQRSREKKQALLLALCLMGLGVSLFLIWVENRVYPGVGSKGRLGGVGREHAQYLALLPTPCFCSWLSRNGSRGSLVFLYLLFTICPTCTGLQLVLVPHSFLYFVAEGEVYPGASFAVLQQRVQVPTCLIVPILLFLTVKWLKFSFSEISSC